MKNKRKPKFKVGQVVGLRKSVKSTLAFRDGIVSVGQVGKIERYAHFNCYVILFGHIKQWFHQVHLRPLTKKEATGK